VDGKADLVVQIDAAPEHEAIAPVLAASPGGVLYAALPGSGTVFRVDLRRGSAARVASGLARPSGLVALADGSLAVLEAAGGRLTRVEVDGRLVAIALHLSSPIALAHHGSRFLVSELSGGRVLALAPGRPPVPVASGFTAPIGVGADRAGRLIVADGTAGAIYRVESDASRSELASGLPLRRVVDGQPVAVPIALDDTGAVLVVARGDGSLWRITPP
jgi:sugar lactone lactonase YvrE